MSTANKLLSAKKLAVAFLITISMFSTAQAACSSNEEALALRAIQGRNLHRLVEAQSIAPHANFIEDLQESAKRDLYGRLPKIEEEKGLSLSSFFGDSFSCFTCDVEAEDEAAVQQLPNHNRDHQAALGFGEKAKVLRDQAEEDHIQRKRKVEKIEEAINKSVELIEKEKPLRVLLKTR